MASGLSNYLKAQLLDYAFSIDAFTPPATIYFALFTVAPTDAGGGTEVAGNAYARVAYTNNAANWPAASVADPSVKSNGAIITFPVASGSWGTVVAAGFYDASTGGNLLGWGDLTSVAINTGNQPAWQIGDIDISWN